VTKLNYADIKNYDIANGPGVRVSLFVSGCTHHCKGCFNKEAWDFNYGKTFDEERENEVLKALEPHYIKGLSLLGGEPFEPQNQQGLIPVLKKAKAKYPEKKVWAYSGYLFDRDIVGDMSKKYSQTNEMLKYVDYIVDGEFKEELKNPTLRFKGSSNQRIIDVQKSLKENKVVLWEEDK
jgi:anaerobic ribonucleoside-triphosphate reductase activating protein